MKKPSQHLWAQHLAEKNRLIKKGLYRPSFEHDACGVGIVADIKSRPSRRVVEMGLAALSVLWHRGAVSADGKTGDGAGISMALPNEFFVNIINQMGYNVSLAELSSTPHEKKFAVGMVFLPRTNLEASERTREIIEGEIIKEGFRIFGWRQVPTDVSYLGNMAASNRPEIEQLIIDNSRAMSPDMFERTLYILRRRIEKKFLAENLTTSYICSLSCRSIVYKGLFLAEYICDFYPDMKRPDFISHFMLYHQRYSTNTFPAWPLAQPFRVLAHNGEINTLSANVNWMNNREKRMENTHFQNIEDILPIVQPHTSDSGVLDNVFELYLRAMRPLPEVKSLLIPEAFEHNTHLETSLRDFYHYAHGVMEPWDGPAAICAVDGDWALAGLDRNGLRPLRFVITDSDLLIVGSENGMVKLTDEEIIEKGRVGPGEMIGINFNHKKLYRDDELKHFIAQKYPYGDWIKKVDNLEDIVKKWGDKKIPDKVISPTTLAYRQSLAGWSLEDLELILDEMIITAKEATGSMGDDSPLAVLSDNFRGFHHFFRQNFAQVTNPPIDSLRERHVMSLSTRLNNLGNNLNPSEKQLHFIELPSPILLLTEWQALNHHTANEAETIPCYFNPTESKGRGKLALKLALDDIKQRATNAAAAGKNYIMLDNSCDNILENKKIPIPMILAASAVHTALTTRGLRSFVSINVICDEALDTHHFAVLIGVGATTITPALAYRSIGDRFQQGLCPKHLTLPHAIKNYQKSINDGLLKIMSKMGIAVVSSYRGGQMFEAVGLSRALTHEFFPDILSRISGLGLEGLSYILEKHFAKCQAAGGKILPIGGFYRFRASGGKHGWDPDAIHLLQEATAQNSYGIFKQYLKQIYSLPPIHIRDLLEIKTSPDPIIDEQLESIADIRRRLVAPGISLGALSPIAHETIAIAMNRIGAKSDSGEGGEDKARYQPRANGDNPSSAIKQIASGRFGVTAEYLNHCEEIEIKMAQGAKPGEGGQLPGFKVSGLIAKLRHSTKGVTLISPPPHHDIYSIEDLAQLIYDLKQINHRARVCVKLVAISGIGTIAAGVAKAKADTILISGHSGGTGASPQTSIKYAGLPWEIGLAETHQVLCLNHLRDRVTLRTDGGIKTGRDVVIAAMLGAEEFGIGTASLVAMGCLMVRQCHSNICPVGICTQNEELIKKFRGSPEKVIALFSLIAEEVRDILKTIGAPSLKDIIGRTELLQQMVAMNQGYEFLDALDLNPLLVKAENIDFGKKSRNIKNTVPPSLDEQIIKDAEKLFTNKEKIQLEYTVANTDRTIGARLASEITRQFGMAEFSPGHVSINLRGTAGQSFAAFAVRGMKFTLTGEANDYVGKGLSGGEIIVRPPTASGRDSYKNAIIGNTCLYGATSGFLYAVGQAGERFAVRNSGARAVVEGMGSNGCEYMTGGEVMCLGAIGNNFAAGMTGGWAFLLEDDDSWGTHLINQESVGIYSLSNPDWNNHAKKLLEDYVIATHSRHAKTLLDNWQNTAKKIRHIVPLEIIKLGVLPYPIEEEKAVA
ncbi:MAG: glutamate synthase large subunit [Alphaproteobacteria bacterium]